MAGTGCTHGPGTWRDGTTACYACNPDLFPATAAAPHLPGRPLADKLRAAWLAPVAGPMSRIDSGKPVSEMTMPEVMDWVTVLAYAGVTGFVAGKIAANILLGGLGRQ